MSIKKLIGKYAELLLELIIWALAWYPMLYSFHAILSEVIKADMRGEDVQVITRRELARRMIRTKFERLLNRISIRKNRN